MEIQLFIIHKNEDDGSHTRYLRCTLFELKYKKIKEKIELELFPQFFIIDLKKQFMFCCVDKEKRKKSEFWFYSHQMECNSLLSKAVTK